MNFLCTQCKRQIDSAVKFCPYCGAADPIPVPSDDPLIGRTVGARYLILQQLGRGGMGLVYKATDTVLDRPVALKVLDRTLLSDETMVQRFHREARAASRLNHPNCITVLDFGQLEDGQLFIAMEFLAGRALDQLLADEFPLAQPRIVNIVAQILAALAEAHAAGIIHRDLKLANVMVEVRRDVPDLVKVLDFGIAKLAATEGASDLTRTGLVCGTPAYMSPEQARGEELDGRSDLYSVGIILYELLTGQLPFTAETPLGLAMRQVTEQPVPPRERRPDLDIAPQLNAIVMRALAKDREARFATAEEMRAGLLAAEVRAAPPAAAAVAQSAAQGSSAGAVEARPASSARAPSAAAPAASEAVFAGEPSPAAPAAPVAPAAAPAAPPPEAPLQAVLAPPLPARKGGFPVWIPVVGLVVLLALAGALIFAGVNGRLGHLGKGSTETTAGAGDTKAAADDKKTGTTAATDAKGAAGTDDARGTTVTTGADVKATADGAPDDKGTSGAADAKGTDQTTGTADSTGDAKGSANGAGTAGTSGTADAQGTADAAGAAGASGTSGTADAKGTAGANGSADGKTTGQTAGTAEAGGTAETGGTADARGDTAGTAAKGTGNAGTRKTTRHRRTEDDPLDPSIRDEVSRAHRRAQELKNSALRGRGR